MSSVLGRTLRSFGIDVVRYPYADRTQLRSTLAKVFDALKINCVLDVGANEGQYGRLLRDMGFKGWILSFEPISSVLPQLMKVADRDGKWRVFPYALGRAKTIAPINVMNRSVFSSFLTPNPVGSAQFGQQNTVLRTESVNVNRLDDVFESCIANIDNPRIYLKLDTQGSDADVFAGAEGALGRMSALQTEICFHKIYFGMRDVFDVLPSFIEKGFEVVDCVPVTRKENGLSAIEMDCIMVHRNVKSEP